VETVETIKRALTMKLPRIDVIGVPITALLLENQIETMIAWAKERSSRVVCVANVHMLMEAYWDDSFHSILREADIVAPDGMPLVWVMRLVGRKYQDRAAGMDIFLLACRKAVKEDVGIYLLGCTEEVLERMRYKLQEDFPGLKLAGAESLPFRPLTEDEDAELIERVNTSQAGLTFIALGCPKQEIWMASHKDKIQSVMLGVGGVFPVYAGTQKRAPLWIRESGLEWLYRLVQEPRRLWGRYQKTIPPFIWLAIWQLVKKPSPQSSHNS
jgi:N-acetylglucosaminyldiphosphoundecaprenol N-acetyl-beta-D-mannosaminyltransferase